MLYRVTHRHEWNSLPNTDSVSSYMSYNSNVTLNQHVCNFPSYYRLNRLLTFLNIKIYPRNIAEYTELIFNLP